MRKKFIVFLIGLISISCFGQTFSYGDLRYTVIDSDKKTCSVSRNVSVSGKIIIPETVSYNNETYTPVEIASSAFNGNVNLISIDTGNSVEKIGSYAFYECTSLISVTIGNKVNLIDIGAFSGCNELEAINIGTSIKTISDEAFDNCNALNKVEVSDIGAWCGINFGKAQNNPLYYARNLYVNGSPASIIEIPEEVKEIMPYTFYNCKNEVTIYFPNSISKIGKSAFENCENIKKVNATNLETWCAIDFENRQAQPLLYAKELTIDEHQISDLSIPISVLRIKPYTFYGYEGLFSISLPPSVQFIGEDAFGKCTNVSRVFIQSIESWCNLKIGLPKGYQLYLNDEEIINLQVPSSVSEIHPYCFRNCVSLETVIIPESITVIEEGVFMNCTNILNVELPPSLKEIRSYSFAYCRKMPYINLPASLYHIDGTAFEYCESFKYISFPEQVTEVRIPHLSVDTALRGFGVGSNTKTIDFYGIWPESITCFAKEPPEILGEFSFYLKNLESVLYVPYGTKEAYASAPGWRNFKYIEDILDLTENFYYNGINYTLNRHDGTIDVTTLEGDWAMAGSTQSVCYYEFYLNPSDIILPQKVYNNRAWGMEGWFELNELSSYSIYTGNINSIHIPPTIKKMGNNCLLFHDYCTQYKKSRPAGVLKVVIDDLAAFCNIIGSRSLHIYEFHLYLKDEEIIDLHIPYGVQNIYPYSFDMAKHIESVYVPSTVKSIGRSAFERKLKKLTLANGVLEIDTSILPKSNNDSLDELWVYSSIPPKFVHSYSDSFIPKTEKTELHVPKGTKELYASSPWWEFFGNIIDDIETNFECNGVWYEIIDEENKLCRVAKNVSLAGNVSLMEYPIKDGKAYKLIEIMPEAFAGNKNITSIIIPNSVENIGEKAFYNCINLKTVLLPSGLTELTNSIFSGCYNLSKITIPTSVEKIGQFSFMDCESLQSIIIPEAVTSLGWGAFSYCWNLRAISMPVSLTTIDKEVFVGCSSLNSISIPNAVETIGMKAFGDCHSITSVYSLNTTPPVIDSTTFTNNTQQMAKLYVPEEALTSYSTAQYWQNFSSISSILFAPGDVTGDGVIDGSDINMLIDIIINPSESSSLKNADVNGDGEIDSSDLNMLIQQVLYK